jgi:hypothetical protein
VIDIDIGYAGGYRIQIADVFKDPNRATIVRRGAIPSVFVSAIAHEFRFPRRAGADTAFIAEQAAARNVI